MPACYSLTGYTLGCKLQEAGAGLNPSIYIGIVDDLDKSLGKYSTNGNGDIEALFFTGYYGLVKFTGTATGNNATTDIQKNEDGNPFYPMSVVMKLFETETADKTFLSNLAIAERLFVIIENNSGKFEVLGIDQGLSVESAPFTRGQTAIDSSARTLTLSGPQTSIEKYFSAGGTYANTVSTLDSYLV